jgi:cytochrome c oxidase assembly protein subunit 15
MRGLVRFSWLVLAYTVLVILGGAWVRVSFSGAGCGDHWPLCNGEVLPTAPSLKTVVEFSHRLTSGINGILVLVLFLWVRRRFAQGHPARGAVLGSLLFLIAEALFGAALVKLGLVETNDSVLRAVFITLHLINTFSLTAFLALVAWHVSRQLSPREGEDGSRRLLSLGLAGVLLSSMAGAITALGDTLFPVDVHDPRPLLERLGEDLTTASHFLIQLRAVHPFLSVFVAFYLWWLCRRWCEGEGGMAQRLAWFVRGILLLQLAVGLMNIGLGAPGWVQLLHLALACLLWVGLVLLRAQALSYEAAAPKAAR